MSQQPADSLPGLQAEAPHSPATGIALPYLVPVVTYSILAITVLGYLAQVTSVAIFGSVYHGIDWMELYGARINDLIRAGQVWRFLTPILLHASPIKLFFNMFFLFILGARLERYFGHRRFLVLYLLGAFSGNVLSFLLANDSTYSVGASTAVFGLFAADVVLLLHNGRLMGDRFRSTVRNDIFLAVLLIPGLVPGLLAPGIDVYGHIGGLLGGATFAWFAGPRWEVERIPPDFQLVDQREWRDVMFGAGLVLLLFGILAAWGMMGGSLR